MKSVKNKDDVDKNNKNYYRISSDLSSRYFSAETSDRRNYLEKWATLRNMGHMPILGSHLEKWVTLGKVINTLKNGSILKNGSHLDI